MKKEIKVKVTYTPGYAERYIQAVANMLELRQITDNESMQDPQGWSKDQEILEFGT